MVRLGIAVCIAAWATGCGSGSSIPLGDLGTTGDLGAGQVPVGGARLFPWLKGKSYGSFAKESAAHASAGPHGGVRTHINPALEGSLKAGLASHPVGAAAVKELYESDRTTLKGWAVAVKVLAASGSGEGWYWYEIFSTTDGSSPVVDGRGATACTGCHAGGKDFVVTSYPLP